MFSENHPDLQNCPRIEKAIAGRKRMAQVSGKEKTKGRGDKKKRRERLSVYDVTQLIQSRAIKSRLELVCLAVRQNKEGKRNLAEFIANRGSKTVDEALDLAKEFSEAEESMRGQRSQELIC